MDTLCLDEELVYCELVANPDQRLQKIEAKLQNVENVGEYFASLKTSLRWLWTIFVIVAAAGFALLVWVTLQTNNQNSTLSRLDSRLGHVEGLKNEVDGIKNDVQEIKGELSILRGQRLTGELSNAPPIELKNHYEELKAVKANLAGTQRRTQEFWTTSVRVISLLSQASFSPELLKQIESKPSNLVKDSSGVRWASAPVRLEGLVQNSVFKNCVVNFDPEVRLVNVTFETCVLVFPKQVTVTIRLQKIINTLLASDLSRVTVTAS